LRHGARELVAYASRLSRTDVLVEELTEPHGHITATVNILAEPGNPHIIRYEAGQERYLNHLVAHECAHLIRYYSAAPDDRLVPVGNTQHRRRAAEEFQFELLRLQGSGLPENALAELLTMWHHGLIRQLTSYPADFRIERWLKERYRDLAEAQKESILHQLSENDKVLMTQARELTPSKVYDTSATMNASFAAYMSRFYEDASLADLYRHSAYWDVGRRLADDISFSGDGGYKSDVRSAKEWARLFRVEEWFEWRRVSDL